MDGRTSQNSPMALVAGDAPGAARPQAGDAASHEATPRTRKPGYALLLAAEALPVAFLEETGQDGLTYREPGDQQVRQAVQDLRQAVTRYNVCWCSAPQQLAGDLYRVFVAPTPDLLHSNRALPLFFTEDELQVALDMAPAPRRSLRSPTPSAQAASQGAVAQSSPELSTPASTSAQGTQSERITVYASLGTIEWAFGTLEQRTKDRRFSFRLRQLWLLRAALRALLRDHQRLTDLPGTDYKVRRVLVCRAQVRPERVKIEPYYEEGQLVGFELSVTVPPELLEAAA